MLDTICPVPIEQRPLNEFKSISNSWLLSWPLKEKYIFYNRLMLSWILILPISLIISYGSPHLKNNTTNYLITSFTLSLILPILLLIRQWLSWKYIFFRLKSEIIEYEESGWYDGQTWEKPIDWRSKDLLIAQYQIKPIINHIEKIIYFCLSLIIVGISIYLSIDNL